MRTPFECIVWAEKHYPQCSAASDSYELELYLRAACVLGSAFNDKYPTGVNQIFIRMKDKDRYLKYFTNRAKLDMIGTQKFVDMAQRGGVKYTNEFMYTSILRGRVDKDVTVACDALVQPYL